MPEKSCPLKKNKSGSALKNTGRLIPEATQYSIITTANSLGFVPKSSFDFLFPQPL